MSTLLRHLAEHSLNGSPEKLKEYAIGVDVFQKDASFDPRIDTTVRTEARRLRAKLEEYYQAAGQTDGVEIALPKGSYRLTFQLRGTRPPTTEAPIEVPAAATPTVPASRLPRSVLTAAASLIAAAAVFVAGYWIWRTRIPSSGPIQSIVVLPFLNLSGDPSRQYLADGITDGLTTDMAAISALRVVSRTSAMSYQSQQKTAPEIGRELGVDAVLEGSMTAQDDRVRVNAQLISARTDEHLWAAAFERQEKDLLRLESDITSAITREIRVRILPDERRRLQSGRDMKPDAYDAYIKGRFFLSHWTEENWRKGKGQFEQAVSLDPGSALAHAGLAAAYCVGMGWAIAPRDSGPQCRQAAETALAIDPSNAEAHRELGGYFLFFAWDFPAAARELRTAVDLNPSNPISHEVYGYYYATVGDLENALREHQTTLRLNPVSLIGNTNVGDIYFFQRRYDDAIGQYRKTLELDPNFAVARAQLGSALLQERRFAEAVSELETASKLEPQPWIRASLGAALAFASKGDDAKRILAELQTESAKRYVSPISIAIIYIGLRRPDQALDWVEKGLEVRDARVVCLPLDAVYDSLRSHPRFQAVLRRAALR
jgi:TolB-like protein/Tfp pilus assembly protein PilF